MVSFFADKCFGVIDMHEGSVSSYEQVPSERWTYHKHEQVLPYALTMYRYLLKVISLSAAIGHVHSFVV